MKRKPDKRNGDLFGEPEPKREPTGLELGHEAAERAADHAGERWKADAYAAFCEYARGHRLFTTEEVRDAHPEIVAPPTLRAWGHIALRAKREGLVVGQGVSTAKARNVHGNMVTLWRSIPPEER